MKWFFSFQYAMRIWLDPNKFNQYQLTISNVATAVRAQNAQVPLVSSVRFLWFQGKDY